MSPRLRLVGASLVLGAIYFVAGHLGLELAFEHKSATAVWPPTGIALAALLIYGANVWPGVFLGAFLVNLTTAGNWGTSFLVASGNTLEAVVGAALVSRFAGGPAFIHQPRTLFRFAAFGALLAPTISATVGVCTLTSFGFADLARFRHIWLDWWLGDASGALLFAPLIIAWYDDPRVRWNRAQAVEASLLLGCIIVLSQAVFGGWGQYQFIRYPSLSMPLLLWPAFRFGPRETCTATFLLFLLALAGTIEGQGPFSSATPFATMLSLQTFVGVLALTTMAAAATNSARLRSAAALARSERELRAANARLNVECTHDPLTGVANRRGFAERLRAEMERSRRQSIPLAMLMIDVDRFRRHNQELGHCAADEVLRAVATLLKGQLRACDHLARYGGDEFVVLLPGTDIVGARATAERCRKTVERSEWQRRHVTVSIGATAIQIDDERDEDVLSIADQALFRAKAAGRNRVSTLGSRRRETAGRAAEHGAGGAL
jgi:diguanylate cyclase (GGDEF)-like protein